MKYLVLACLLSGCAVDIPIVDWRHETLTIGNKGYVINPRPAPEIALPLGLYYAKN